MFNEPSPSAEAHEMWSISDTEALALVDEHLGLPEDWSASALLEYRLSADFQADWKAEVGHWLYAAKQCGFLERMLKPIFGERDRKYETTERDAGDRRHLKLHQHLATAMMCHYFTSKAIGWSFSGWETDTGGAVDIDLALREPRGTLVEWQVKAPDQPGNLENGRYVGGNFDSRVIESLEHAAAQLPQLARSVALIGVYAQRNFSLASKPACITSRLYGSTRQGPVDGVFLPRDEFGHFTAGRWNHVAGVIAMDLVRGIDVTRYTCTVLLNPNSTQPASPEWFPRSRVLVLEGDVFRWVRGEPTDIHYIPTGTKVVDELPW